MLLFRNLQPARGGHAEPGRLRAAPPPPAGEKEKGGERRKKGTMAPRLGPVATAALLAALLHNAPPGAAQFIGGGFTNSHCDFSSFQARAAEVTAACCEGKGDEVCPAGPDGLPSTPVACGGAGSVGGAVHAHAQAGPISGKHAPQSGPTRRS